MLGGRVFVAAALLGMRVLAKAMGSLFVVLKYVGGAYLTWLGASLLRSKEAQDHNLPMLLDWIADYETRTDGFYLSDHRELFDSHRGQKQELKSKLEAR